MRLIAFKRGRPCMRAFPIKQQEETPALRLLMPVMLIAAIAIIPASAKATSEDKAVRAPDQTTEQGGSFLDSPAKGLAEIYKDYHDWNLKSGIERAQGALKEIDALYAREPRAEFADSSLKLNRVFQIKSTLHTLLGMLYYRKSMIVLRDGGAEAEQALLDKITKGDEVREEDLERVAEEAERGSSAKFRKDNLMASAISQFRLASDVDPSNPSPHYQMASVYSAMPPLDSANMAEAEYFKGAELSIKEGQRDTARGALEAIRNMNPRSAYIAKLEKLLANQ